MTQERKEVREIVDLVNKHQSPEDWMYSLLCSLPCEPPTALPSEWATNKRYMTSTATPFPGKWSWKRSPWFRDVVDHLSPHDPVQKIGVMKATQIAFTAAVLENAVGFTMDCHPGPLLYVTGNEELVDTTKKTRLDPMVDNSGLRDKIRPDSLKRGIKRTGDSGNITEFPGGFMRMCGPAVESNFQGISYKVLLLDEVDLYPPKLGRSGETVKVIEGRADAFGPRKKILEGSRPTVAFGLAEQENANAEKGDDKPKAQEELGSRILDIYNLGDKRKYHVPCPHCGTKQELVFFKGTTHEGVSYGLHFDKDACKTGDYSSVEYRCRSCGGGIKEYHKMDMVQPENGAEWVPTATPREPLTVSYQISSMYSLTVSWQEMVVEFLGSTGDPVKMQLFYNRFLGLPFEDRTGGVDLTKISEKAGQYLANTVPDDVLFLTAAVDVQRGKKGRLEVEIRGWGRNHQNWGIDYRIIKGNTEDKHDECYARLSDILDETWGPRGLMVERMLIDSGDGAVTATIYEVCRMYGRGDQVLMLPLKGLPVSGTTRIYQKMVDLPGERFPLVEVYSDRYKNKLALWLKQDWRHGEDAPIGWTMFPEGPGYGREYFRQLTNDEKLRIRKGQHTIIQWKSRGKIESWDVLVYNAACEDFVLEDYSVARLGLEKSVPEAVWDYFEAVYAQEA